MENNLDSFFNFEDIMNYKSIFEKNKKVQIKDILANQVAEILFKQAVNEKNWVLATGHDATKYEKRISKQFEKVNAIQIKKIQDKFKNDHFSYIFSRSMNNIQPSFLEYTLRKNMASEEFIHYLNEITNLKLTKLNTLFLSKYKGGNFLSPHSDNGNGKLAFVLNLTKNWKPQYGGILHFMNDTKTEIVESFTPLFNNLMLFEVPEGGIPHFVSHVVPYVKQERYSITGWYE